ncbi:MAG: HNH endonuclease [Acidobacteria bacterium]|nr:HNH endonuclease [Acidobacteriota bacterium]
MFGLAIDEVRGFEPGLVPLPEAAAAWHALDQLERAVVGAKLALACRVEESSIWLAKGHRSAADYLAKVSGTSVGYARGLLAASKQLAEQPLVAESSRAGLLSGPQVVAIADAVAAAPDTASELIGIAGRQSLRELQEVCARVKHAALPDPKARHAKIREGRFARKYSSGDGGAEIRYRSTPDEVGEVWQVLSGYAERAFKDAHTDGRREASDAYAADGMLSMARAAAGSTTGQPVVRKGIVRIDWDAFIRGYPISGEVCEIAGVGPVPVELVRNMAASGDLFLTAVVTRGVDVVNVAHLGRRPNAHQQTALDWYDVVCTREGCGHRDNLQVDHRVDWADTKITALRWLDWLCAHDHQLKTHHGWALVTGTGKRPMVPRGHPDHPGTSKELAAAAARAGPDPPR